MYLPKTHLNWFDLLVMALVAVGIWRGRKRGISEELLDVLQWLCIVVVGALGYVHFGRMIATATHLPPLYANLMAYTAIAGLLKVTFSSIKRAAGEKLVQSDAFGRLEYYLGMVAGVIRFTCILLFALSFLHAKYISDAERAATAKMQEDNFGSISFPTIGSLQHSVFYESISGQFIRRNLRAQLVQPAPGRFATGETIGHMRQRDFEEVLK